MRRAFLIWLSFIPLAITNGWLRETVLFPIMGHYALPLSGVILCLLILGVSVCSIHYLKRSDFNFYVFTGLFWVILTLIFEFSMGLLLLQKSLWDLLLAYDPTTENFWLLVIVVIGISPLSAAKIRRMI